MSYKDSTGIEGKAVNAINLFFEDSNIVSTFIAKNDKEPFWDGHLYLYPNGIKKNENFKGRITAQVKGKDLKEFKVKNFSHPIDMPALKAYLQEGVVYMVVQEVGKERKIFHRYLTPVLIRSIIRVHKGQKTANVIMFPLSEDIKEVETELLQFEIDCKKQISSADSEPLNFDTWMKMGVNSFSVTLASSNKSRPFIDLLTSKPNYLYANINGDSRIQIPIGEGPLSMEFSIENKEPVCVKKQMFYYSYTNKIGKDKMTISVGYCLELIIEEESKKDARKMTVNIKRGAKFLKEVINETEFILAMADAGEVTIGKVTMKMPLGEHELVNELRNNIEALKELEATLCKIGINEDLDLSSISQEEERTINILIEMIGHNNEISLKEMKTGLYNVKIANLNLLLVVLKSESGKYIMKNLFDKSLGIQASYIYPDGKFVESIYGKFNKQMILDCYNFPYQDIIPSYEATKDANPHIYESMNLFMLELLCAYDMMEEGSSRKEMALKAITDMSDWLINNDTNGDNMTLHLINKYQILKRKRKLTDTEVNALKQLQLENTTNSFLECGIYLLLDDSYTFDFYWKKLTTEEQKRFKNFPIWIYKK